MLLLCKINFYWSYIGRMLWNPTLGWISLESSHRQKLPFWKMVSHYSERTRMGLRNPVKLNVNRVRVSFSCCCWLKSWSSAQVFSRSVSDTGRNAAHFCFHTDVRTWIYTHVPLARALKHIFQWRVRLLKDMAGVALYFSFCQQIP